MPRNGSGTYQLPAGNPVVPSTVISSTWANNTLSDLGTAVTQSLANDGQTTPVANLPMATFRHTNVGNAVARNDYAAAGQVQDSSLQWLTSVAGTNTITASISPGPAAYAAGQKFRFVPANDNTGAVTININGLGAKSITKNGTGALTSGDIRAGQTIELIYDGTQFQIPPNGNANAQSGNMVVLTVGSGNFTVPSGVYRLKFQMVGGGGAGGAGAATFSGGAGGAGGFCEGVVAVSPGQVMPYVVGAGGAAAAGNGNPGAATTFAAATANGGGGGQASAGPSVGGGGGGTASGATFNQTGGDGGDGNPTGITFNQAVGGASYFGGGGRSGSGGGIVGKSFGSGGGGSYGGAGNGGAGAAGILIIEY